MEINFVQLLERYDEHVKMIHVFEVFLKEKDLSDEFDKWLENRYVALNPKSDKNLHN
jgi:hypothetical protein